MTTYEQCMNPACERTGTIYLMAFDKYVGMVCQQCSDGLAHRAGALTPEEREVIADAGRLWNRLCQIVGTGPTREADLNELVVHIHAIQQAVMSQAAGRAHPGEFRLLGETLRESGA